MEKRFGSKDWKELGFSGNEEAFEYLDKDSVAFYTLLTDAFNAGKNVPVPWQRFCRGQQSEQSARSAIRNSLKSNSGRRGIQPKVDLAEFISAEDKKKISDIQKRLEKLQAAALEAAKIAKAKSDAQKRILELAEQAGLKVKLE
jgi:hypothetical protein